MYDIERQQKILDILSERKTISVNKLSELLYCSGATTRRDLVRMEQKGLVTRTFGAVMLNANASNRETSFELREKNSISEKRILCQKAVDFIRNNSTIFMDSSTTLLHLVPFLKNFTNLTIITNGLVIANEIIYQTKHSVIVVGGMVQPNTNSILGSMALSDLSRFHADLTLISCGGIDLDFGLSESTIDSAEIKKYMVNHAEESICLFDSTKTQKKKSFKTCQIEDIDILIPSRDCEKNFLEGLKEKNIKVIY